MIINNATIILKSGSSVVFYLDYPIEDFPSGGYFGNGSGNNFTITQEGTAPQSRNFMILEVSNCSTIAFKNSGTFYGVIYAPSTTIDINNVNSGILYGSFVGETVHFGNNFDLHHDPTLGSNTNPCIIKEWQEVP